MIGTVDPHIVVALLAGSLPGVVLGSYFAVRVAEPALRLFWLRRLSLLPVSSSTITSKTRYLCSPLLLDARSTELHYPACKRSYSLWSGATTAYPIAIRVCRSRREAISMRRVTSATKAQPP